MTHAEHVIGLTAKEQTRPGDPASVASVLARYRAIRAGGVLLPRVEEKPLGADGSLFDLDRLAGDNRYIFLSYGARYRDLREPALCYGFVFDAERLIVEHGALVGGDMLDYYESLLEQCIAEVAATLPPLPVISEEELADFAAMAGDDPAMLDYVREQSVRRDSDIDMAIRIGDMSEPGAAEAVALFQARVGALQAQHRASGAAALAALREGVEVLVPHQLPISDAVGFIEAGAIILIE
jgi:hypothetical protein